MAKMKPKPVKPKAAAVKPKPKPVKKPAPAKPVEVKAKPKPVPKPVAVKKKPAPVPTPKLEAAAGEPADVFAMIADCGKRFHDCDDGKKLEAITLFPVVTAVVSGFAAGLCIPTRAALDKLREFRGWLTGAQPAPPRHPWEPIPAEIAALIAGEHPGQRGTWTVEGTLYEYNRGDEIPKRVETAKPEDWTHAGKVHPLESRPWEPVPLNTARHISGADPEAGPATWQAGGKVWHWEPGYKEPQELRDQHEAAEAGSGDAADALSAAELTAAAETVCERVDDPTTPAPIPFPEVAAPRVDEPTAAKGAAAVDDEADDPLNLDGAAEYEPTREELDEEERRLEREAARESEVENRPTRAKK